MLRLKDYRLILPLRARFRDTDGMGHVNNAVYLTYFEEARAAWFRQATGLLTYREVGIILARTRCDFRSPLLPGEEIGLGARVESIGTKSFTMSYRGEERAGGRLICEGESVQVWFDYREERSVPVPDEFRRQAAEFEGRSF